MKRILVTGGAGYIGSHAVRELEKNGYTAVVYDNLSEGHREAVVAGKFEKGDLSEADQVDSLFRKYQFSAVMHFASRCYVGESMENPMRYYQENVGNALILFRVMLKHGVRSFILSSTCATYGDPERIPIDEDHPQDPVNPYGESKYFIERILKQYDRAYGLRFVSLRYFNAAGASEDGLIGESHDPETHLIPLLLAVAAGKRNKITVFGNDYPTDDGTCIRDYIHVLDLASAHVAALQWLEDGRPSEFFNLGTGVGQSIREVLKTAVEITGVEIPFVVGPRRLGDPPELVAAAAKANRELRWTPRFSDLRTILKTAWLWETNRRY
jgi:UDP-glucose-4-epimerase GalE